MKKYPKNYKILSAFSVAAATLSACMPQTGSDAPASSGSQNSTLGSGGPGGSAGTASEVGAVGVRPFSQILPAMAAVTGVDEFGYGTLKTYHAEVSATLPLRGGALEVTSSTLIAQTSIASFFCFKMVQALKGQTPAVREIYKTVDFSKGPVTALTPAVREAVVRDTFNKLLLRAPVASELSIGVDLLTGAVDPASITSSDTEVAVRAECALVLSSPDFMTI